MQETETNMANAELISDKRTLRQAKANLYDTNIIQNLPAKCALIIGIGQAKLALTSPIPVNKRTLQLHDAEPINKGDTVAENMALDSENIEEVLL